MADAKRDDNGVPGWLGLSCIDGVTPVPIKVNASNGGMHIDLTSTIGFTPRTSAGRDANDVATKLAKEGVNVFPLYVNPSTGGVLMEM